MRKWRRTAGGEIGMGDAVVSKTREETVGLCESGKRLELDRISAGTEGSIRTRRGF